MKKKTNLIKPVQFWGLIYLIAIGLIFGIIDLLTVYQNARSHMDQLRENHIKTKKQMVQQEVYQVADMINQVQERSQKLVKSKIKSRVYEGYTLVEKLYHEHRTSKTEAQLKQMIVNILRHLRFENNKGYFFIIQTDGQVVLNADKPQLEKKDLLHIQDIRGKSFIKEMVEIGRTDGEGFCEYFWSKPDISHHQFKKNSFVKIFTPYNWVIGTGLYVDDIESRIKIELLEMISKIRFGKEGYIFINRLNGDALVSNGKVFSGTRKLWEVFNKYPEKTKEIFRKEYKAALESDGDYIYYSWIKLSTSTTLSPKTSFIYGIPDLNWLVGAGVYLDDVESEIALEQTKLKNEIIRRVIYFTVFAVAIMFLFLILFRRMSQKLGNDLNLFVLFFNRAADSHEAINREHVQFHELDQMAQHANNMLLERQQVEEALIESKEKYRAMMEAMKDAVYICSENLTIEYMNPAMVEKTGQDATGQACYQAIYQNDQQCSWCAMRQVQKGQHLEYELTDPDKTHYYLLSNSPIYHEDGTISKLTISRDITETRKMAEHLQQSQKMESIGTLAGGIAHDFNNILFPIIGHTEMLMEDVKKKSPMWESLNKILTSAMRASDLVRQILTFSRQKSSEVELITLQPIIKEVLKLIRSTIPATIDIQQQIDPDCGPVAADPTQIHQIVMNLSTNAFHAMEEKGGTLKVTLKEKQMDDAGAAKHKVSEGLYACLKVMDSGVGMDQKLISRVFDPFFTTKGPGKGTGMGLSIVHGIVSNSGGFIEISSDPGQYTSISVYLPIARMTAKTVPSIDTDTSQHGDECILLVDDEETVVTMESEMLTKLGYKVISFTDSIKALENFGSDPDQFDLVITDTSMPNMSGDQLTKEILNIRPDIPVIICTGFSRRISEEDAESLGVKGILMKPILKNDLIRMVRKTLDDS